jgi:hypothetical protein
VALSCQSSLPSQQKESLVFRFPAGEMCVKCDREHGQWRRRQLALIVSVALSEFISTAGGKEVVAAA